MTILFSCGEDAKSDKDKKKDKYKKEIKDPCDILDYTIEIFENLERLSDEYDDIDDLEDDKKDKKKVNAYFDDLEDAWKYSFKKFDEDEMIGLFGNCNNSEDMAESLYEVEYFFEERAGDFTDFIDMKMYDLRTEYHEREDAAADYGHAEEAPAEEAKEEATVEEEVIEGDGYYDGYNNGEEEYDDEWSYEEKELFMRECTSGDSDMYDYCECVIEELMYVYTTNEIENIDEDEVIEFIQFATDCLELINYDEY